MGIRYTGSASTSKKSPPPIQQKKSGAGAMAAKGVSSVQKTLDTLDKMHETRLENSALLTSKDWTLDVGGKTKDIFKRVDSKASLNPIDYYKRSTTPTYSRIKIDADVMKEHGFSKIKEMLKSQDYTDKQILDIARNSGVKIHDYDPGLMNYDPKYDPMIPGSGPKGQIPGGKRMVGKDELVDVEPSGISKSLDRLQDYVGDKAGDIGGGIADVAQWGGGQVSNLAGDIGELGKAFGGGIADFGGDILDATGKVGDYGAHVLGTAMHKGGKLLGNVAGQGGKLAGNVGKIAGNVGGAVGSAVGKAAPVVGAVTGGVQALGGVKDIFSGEVGQGVEDLVQGGIGLASPLLLAAGPAGWAVLGASFLEDMLFD